MFQKLSNSCKRLKFLYDKFDRSVENCQHQLYSYFNLVRTTGTEALSGLPQNFSPPQVVPGRKKKPYVGVREGSARKRENKSRKQVLHPPEDGTLVQSLIPVAHKVLKARETFFRGVSLLMKEIPVKACRVCPEIHVGPLGHSIKTCEGPHNGARNGCHDWLNADVDKILFPVKSYHVKDRLARPVSHEKRSYFKRIPSIVELCIQAGVDIPEFPTVRRNYPLGVLQWHVDNGKGIFKQASLGRKLVADNEYVATKVESKCGGCNIFGIPKEVSLLTFEAEEPVTVKSDSSEGIAPDTCRLYVDNSTHESGDDQRVTEISERLEADTRLTAERTLEAWTLMRNGVRKLMKRYPVKVCGYCPEVHVGTVGHKVRFCKAYKNQTRGGHHGWQQAALHDIVPHQFVWHVPDVNGPPLVHELRKYYGKVPAVVELCVQAGASIPDVWRPFMRLDVVKPLLEEHDKVA